MKNNIYRICRIAVMSALCFVLALLTLKIGNLRIGFGSLPICLSAILFSPIEGGAVGALGELLSQIINYGITLTTPLWILPPAVRGLLIGRLLKGKTEYHQYVFSGMISAFIVTLLNTAVTALDSIIYGYYSYQYVFADLGIRLITGQITAVLVMSLLFIITPRIKKSLKIK